MKVAGHEVRLSAFEVWTDIRVKRFDSVIFAVSKVRRGGEGYKGKTGRPLKCT